MMDPTEFLRARKKESENDEAHFNLERYLAHKDSKAEYAKKFGNIKPGLLIGTNIKFKGREDA